MGLREYGAGKIASRPLEFIWILDVSGSMEGDKIQSLNTAIRDCIPAMVDVADNNINAQVYVRALLFGTNSNSGVSWHIAQRTEIKDFKWVDVTSQGGTPLGAAYTELAKVLETSAMPDRGLPPVLVLITDGMPNDNWKKPLEDLLKLPWAKKAVRIGIAIGNDCDEEVIKKFINNVEIKPLKADSASQLTAYIKWASTQVLSNASATKSTNDTQSNSNVIVSKAPTILITDEDDIF
jgi:uncharacterized protein YegL